MDDRTLTACALAAGAGEADAAEAFVRASHRDVWRFVAHLDDIGHADDLAQETFLRAWRALPRFTGASSARTWLLAIARRVVVDDWRTRAARPQTVPVPEWRDDDPVTGAAGVVVGRFDEGVALTDLCRTLARERREAFVLTQVLGLGYEETAGLLGCPVGTVRSRVARARGDLVAALDAAG